MDACALDFSKLGLGLAGTSETSAGEGGNSIYQAAKVAADWMAGEPSRRTKVNISWWPVV